MPHGWNAAAARRRFTVLALLASPHPESLTSILPVFTPFSIPISAFGAFSMPS